MFVDLCFYIIQNVSNKDPEKSRLLFKLTGRLIFVAFELRHICFRPSLLYISVQTTYDERRAHC